MPTHLYATRKHFGWWMLEFSPKIKAAECIVIVKLGARLGVVDFHPKSSRLRRSAPKVLHPPRLLRSDVG